MRSIFNNIHNFMKRIIRKYNSWKFERDVKKISSKKRTYRRSADGKLISELIGGKIVKTKIVPDTHKSYAFDKLEDAPMKKARWF